MPIIFFNVSTIITDPYLNQKKACRLIGIKRATFYYQTKIINKKQKELRIRKKIEEISREHPYYGYRRITAQLRRGKVIVNYKKVLK